MKQFDIIEKDGKMYRKMTNGGLLLIKECNPLFKDMPEHSGIYCITCLITGKKYIGSSVNVKRRLQSHVNKHKSIDFNNASVELLEDCKYLNNSDLKLLERDLILQHNTLYPNGFNIKLPLIDKDFPVMNNKPRLNKSNKKTKFWNDACFLDLLK